MSYPERRGRELSHAAQGAFVILAILFGAFMFAVGLYVGQNSEPEGEGGAQVTATDTAEETAETETGETETEAETETETEGEETETEGGGSGAEGEQVFASAGCGSCHTLEEAGSSGTIGPKLDDTGLDRDQIEQKVREGGGAMPPFEGQLDDEQIEAVADFVEDSKG